MPKNRKRKVGDVYRAGGPVTEAIARKKLGLRHGDIARDAVAVHEKVWDRDPTHDVQFSGSERTFDGFALARDRDPTVIGTNGEMLHRATHSNENIARVVHDIRTGHAILNPNVTEDGEMVKWTTSWMNVAEFSDVIDATVIYESLADHERAIDMYDRTMAPPFDAFIIGYENEHGNDIVMLSVVGDRKDNEDAIKPWQNSVCEDWENVRWSISTTVWVGGRCKNRSESMPTHGPMFMWMSALYEDGRPADLRWILLDEGREVDDWDMAHVIFLETMSFLSCTNIDIAEPEHPRGERRRLQRLAPGVRVKQLVVKQRSTRSGSKSGFSAVGGVPLHTVRGHFSHYGACCSSHEPRGLLFGKYTGKVFVPGHARGSSEHGEIDKSYVPTPESS